MKSVVPAPAHALAPSRLPVISRDPSVASSAAAAPSRSRARWCAPIAPRTRTARRSVETVCQSTYDGIEHVDAGAGTGASQSCRPSPATAARVAGPVGRRGPRRRRPRSPRMTSLDQRRYVTGCRVAAPRSPSSCAHRVTVGGHRVARPPQRCFLRSLTSHDRLVGLGRGGSANTIDDLRAGITASLRARC